MDKFSRPAKMPIGFRVKHVALALGLLMASHYPLTANAISVGDVDIQSALNQPLSARIHINFSPGENIKPGNLQVKIANPQQHNRNGLLYPSVLQKARFRKLSSANGVVVEVTTDRPIQEPLLNFLLQLDWPAGRLLKEVPLFLDPPGYQTLPVTAAIEAAPKPIKTAQPVPAAAPSVAARSDIFVNTTTYSAADLLTEEAAPTPKPASQPKPRRKAPRSRIVIEDGQYGPVRPGDTLYKIARAAAGKGASKSDIEAQMKAIYFANPDAFTGSINSLEKGSYLIVPTPNEVPEQVLSAGIAELEHLHANVAEPMTVAATADSQSATESGQQIAQPPSNEPPASTATQPPEAAAVAPSQRAQLDILPADRAAQEIARGLSERIGQATTTETSSSPEQTTTQSDMNAATSPPPATQQSSTESVTIATDQSALQTEVARLEKKNAALEARITDLSQTVTDLKKTLRRLQLKLDELATAQSQFQFAEGSLSDKVLRWGPWALLLLLLPALGFALLRGQRRNAEAVASEPEDISPGERVPPPEPLVEPERQIMMYPPSTAAEGIQADEIASSPTTQHPSPSDTSAENERFDELGDTALLDEETSLDLPADLKPTTSDTQETIRPAGIEPAIDNESTQILNRDGESAQSLDKAQEAEIYLAYEQFSLAEKTIDELLAEDPNNDRNKLLQLKLFAEVGRMTELQDLSVELLQKYPDPESGMHQQVQNICERAFSRHAAAEIAASRAANVVAEEESDEAPTLAQTKVEPRGEDTLDALTVDTIFKEDIEDYLSDKTALELSDYDAEQGDETTALTPVGTVVDTDTDDLDLESLTDEEIEALSQELELSEEGFGDIEDDALDSIRLETMTDNHEAQVEKFSDTDLKLPEVDIDLPNDDPLAMTGGLLDIEFDLEAELDKSDTPPQQAKPRKEPQ